LNKLIPTGSPLFFFPGGLSYGPRVAFPSRTFLFPSCSPKLLPPALWPSPSYHVVPGLPSPRLLILFSVGLHPDVVLGSFRSLERPCSACEPAGQRMVSFFFGRFRGKPAFSLSERTRSFLYLHLPRQFFSFPF